MFRIVFIIIAVLIIMVFMGASILESEHIKQYQSNNDKYNKNENIDNYK